MATTTQSGHAITTPTQLGLLIILAVRRTFRTYRMVHTRWLLAEFCKALWLLMNTYRETGGRGKDHM